MKEKPKTGRKKAQDPKVQITFNVYVEKSKALNLDLDEVKEQGKQLIYKLIEEELK